MKSAADLISLPTTVEDLQKVKGKARWNYKRNLVENLSINIQMLVSKLTLQSISLFQSVATIGSTLTSVQHDVKTMQAALENEKKDDDFKKKMVN